MATFKLLKIRLLLLFVLHLFVIQGVIYTIQHESIKMVSYNKDFIYNPIAEIVPYNKTSQAYNMSITFIRPMAPDVRVGLTPFVYRAKAYRKFPYELAPNICEMFAKNEFGVHIVYDYSNFHGCPIEVNVTYYVRNFMMNDKKIPQSAMIPGKYRVDAKVFHRTLTFGTFELRVSIVPKK